MKLIVLFAVLGAVCAAPASNDNLSSLVDDFHDFLKLIPVDEIKAIVNKHLENDGEFGNVIRYLQSAEWATLVETIRSKPEVQDFAKYMKDAGLDVVGLVAEIHNYLASLKPGTEPGKDGSLRPFLDDVERVIPLDKLMDLLNQKMENSQDFQSFYKRISSQQAKKLVEDVRALPEIQRLNQRLTQIGVKVEEIMEIVYDFLGWDTVSEYFAFSSLIDDFHDILKLIPVNQIKAIVNKHLENDAEFGNVIRYLQSAEWAKLLETIRAKPEVQDFAKYMKDAGLDVVGLMTKIHNYLARLKPGTEPGKDGSLRPFLDEVEGVIPLYELMDLLNKKMESPYFHAFYMRISSRESKKLVEAVRALPEIKRLNQRLTNVGVRVEEFEEMVYDCLGWKWNPVPEYFALSSLIDDFHDFLKLIPVDQIKAIVNKHLENDAEFGNVIRYLQSAEWAQLVETIRSKPEVQDFAKYMKDAGLDVVGLVAKIHNYLANLKPGTEPGKDGSLRSFLDEVEGVIPLDKLMDLLNQKMENSQDFQAFYKRISSQEAKKLVEGVRALPEVQRLNQRLTQIGVKVEEIMEIVYDFLGWDTVSEYFALNSLIDDFHDFLKLIPVDQIKAIVNKHLDNDAEFGNVIRYLQSAEWATLVETIRSKPEVQDFDKYMKDAGLDVVGLVAKIHNYLASLKPGTEPGKDGSLRPFLDEVEGVIPLDKLKDLLNQKMENSEDFQAFYKKISSQQAKTLVEDVRALPEVQRLNQRLTKIGVKVEEIMEIVYDFLGWDN